MKNQPNVTMGGGGGGGVGWGVWAQPEEVQHGRVCCHVPNTPKTRKCGFQSEMHYTAKIMMGFGWGVYGADCIC